MLTGRVNAPEINTKYGWLNTKGKSYFINDFKGKIVLLDFWTLGCINCQHIIPDLQRLEAEYPEELVVIGVHSAKFDNEKMQHAIRKAILKFGIKHPVVNDAGFEVWKHYAVNAWPTIVLIDPDGKVIGQRAGEGIYDIVKPNLALLIENFEKKLNRTIFPFQPEEQLPGILEFPSKLIASPMGDIYLADSGHHRILKINQEGSILQVIGSGERGFTNGSITEATFNEPHGLALHASYLYIADAKNNAIRKVDLKTDQVTTIAGTGELSYYFFEDSLDAPVNPNSPWDLVIEDETLYIASAGNHQILKMDLKTESVWRFAGTGREALADGTLLEAAFNQPSGLALHNGILYIADAEASAIRAIDLNNRLVSTLIGTGLFDFGDVDGDLDGAQLQHAMGISFHQNQIYLADTYNGKIKAINLDNNRITTILAGLDEPNDVTFIDDKMWVTDTNHHQLIKVDLSTGEKFLVSVNEKQ
ncbi:thioredoxin-like domain-containing protein [Adhaeribacter pallidiroseus]|uniref:NHL repeat-containing protein n=1 Tax=Adhaeribacter pallidiroseus TaxID=2072847 RepID=A0A369QMQ1_9BACT|nr:thioredoxin-like domain-containing protein [Adhaeribacter pallidiroseus]RDC66024.1 NHL repeat-containing protein [Adhaeribacter pallidiroseus]